jgi:hypothetical protein
MRARKIKGLPAAFPKSKSKRAALNDFLFLGEQAKSL